MGEEIGRILMLVAGFAVVMLGFITFIHGGEHRLLGILILFGGVATMFAGLPSVEDNSRLDESFKKAKQMEFKFDK